MIFDIGSSITQLAWTSSVSLIPRLVYERRRAPQHPRAQDRRLAEDRASHRCMGFAVWTKSHAALCSGVLPTWLPASACLPPPEADGNPCKISPSLK